MQFFVYSRKSVYTGKGESIENQIEMCRQYISVKFPSATPHEITIYEDEGFSAKNTDRPQFQQMRRDIQTKKPDFLVCYRLDRISRNVSDFSTLIEDLNHRHIAFVCIKEEFDTSKPMGKAMMYIASVFAQLERETIAERVRDNMLMLARTGRWLGGTTPTGYTSEKQQELILDGRVKTSCKLRDNPEELVAVDAIFEKFLELRSVSGVSKFLIKQGIHSRSRRPYSLLGIKEILQNPVYCMADRDALDYFTAQGADVCFVETDCSAKLGLLAYNKRDYKKKHAPRQSMDKWIVAIGRHKGRIPGRRWVSAQQILADNIPSGKRPATMHNDYALLSGLIFCENCGGRMFAKQRCGKGANSALYDYVCGNKLRGGTALCNGQNVNGRQADELICAALMEHAGESCRLYPLLEKRKQELAGQASQDPLALLDARIKRCGDELDNLVCALSRGSLGDAFFQRVNARVRELDETLSALTAERSQVQQNEISMSDWEMQVDLLADRLCDWNALFCDCSVQEKRTLVKSLVQRIVWDGEALQVFLDGA